MTDSRGQNVVSCWLCDIIEKWFNHKEHKDASLILIAKLAKSFGKHRMTDSRGQNVVSCGLWVIIEKWFNYKEDKGASLILIAKFAKWFS